MQSGLSVWLWLTVSLGAVELASVVLKLGAAIGTCVKALRLSLVCKWAFLTHELAWVIMTPGPFFAALIILLCRGELGGS